jgi:hypothetical protein
MGRTLHHPHLPTTFSDYAHDPRMGDCILDFHRGTVDFLRCQLELAIRLLADLQFPRLFEITVHLDLDGIEFQYYHVSVERAGSF